MEFTMILMILSLLFFALDGSTVISRYWNMKYILL